MIDETKTKNYTILKPQPTEQNPVIVDNYPYGFRLRTKIKYYVESVKRKGDRFISQTLNPKTQKWNKPKKSTYDACDVVYKNEDNGHISYFALWRSTDKESYERFIKNIGDVEFNEIQKEEMRILRAYIKTYENVTFNCSVRRFKHKITGEITESVPIFHLNEYNEIDEEGNIINTEEEHNKQEKVKKDIRKVVAYNYVRDGGSL